MVTHSNSTTDNTGKGTGGEPTGAQAGPERRRHERVPIRRACKVFHRGTWRYLSGATCDASAGGVLVEMDTPRDLTPGDPVDVAVATELGVVLRGEEFVAGKVVRVQESEGGRLRVAVKLIRPLNVPVPA